MEIDPVTGEIVGAEKFRCFTRLMEFDGKSKRTSLYFGVSKHAQKYRYKLEKAYSSPFFTALEAAEARDIALEDLGLTHLRKSVVEPKAEYKNCPKCDKKCIMIPLTHEKTAVVRVSDFDLIKDYVWNSSKQGKSFYAFGKTKKQTIRMHAIIFGSLHPDHIDLDGLNNCRCNLRECNKSTNGANTGKILSKTKQLTSVFKGVCKVKHGWTAGIHHQYKRIPLGYYNTEIEAAIAYNNAAKEIYGEFAYLNEIPSEYKNVVPSRRVKGIQ